MTAYEAYKIFMGVRLHFKGEYDYFKYGPLATKPETFENRTDKFKFVKLARMYEDELVWATAFAMYNKPDVWVTGMFPLHIIQEWVAFKARQLSTLNVQKDLKMIVPGTYHLATTCPGNSYPPLFMMMGRGFGVDTLLILDSFHGFLAHWKDHYKDDHVMQYFIKRVNAFRPFYFAFNPLDRPKYQDILGEFKCPSADADQPPQ